MRQLEAFSGTQPPGGGTPGQIEPAPSEPCFHLAKEACAEEARRQPRPRSLSPGQLSSPHLSFQPANKSLLPLSRCWCVCSLLSSLKSLLPAPRGLPRPQPVLQGASSHSSPAVPHLLMSHNLAGSQAWGQLWRNFHSISKCGRDGHIRPRNQGNYVQEVRKSVTINENILLTTERVCRRSQHRHRNKRELPSVS